MGESCGWQSQGGSVLEVQVTPPLPTPTLSLSTSGTPSIYGQYVDFTATFPSGGPTTGTISFYDGSTLIGSGTINGASAAIGINTLTTGTHTLTASWPGNSSYSYATSNAITETIVVPATQATPVITWPTPAAISYGTPLSGTQLNATANVAGTFVYWPAAGEVLESGSQVLLANFFPTDSTDYTTASGSTTIQVNSGSVASIYSFTISPPSGASGYDGVGNVLSYTDSVMGTWSMAGGYDSLNRLTTASASAGPYAGLQTGWSYDSFGNRTAQSFSGSVTAPMPTSTTAAYSANNQVSSASLMLGAPLPYDAAGDVTQDNQNAYLYDAEGRVCAAENLYTGAITGYVYDAEGTRVAKGSLTWTGSGTANWSTACSGQTGQNNWSFTVTNSYVLGPSGEQLTEVNTTSGTMRWAHTNIYAAGSLIATYDAGTNSPLHFNLSDWLGTRRVSTDYQGNITETCTSLPFGDGLSCSGPDPTEHHFTGKERDAESGNDYFGARYYASTMGRWLSPDLPFADQNPENPQSWNLYGYVRNNPLSSIDTNGRVTWLIGGTWHKASDWTASSPLGQEMAGFFDPSDDDVEQIEWSGGNSAAARAELAAKITAAMASHAWKPGEQNNIVCHSHGCNGVMGALPTLLADGYFVNNLVSLGQPMRGDYPYSGGVDAWWNVYAGNDLAQKLGGRIPFFGGRTNSNAVNIQVNTGKNFLQAHGALHNDWLTRMQWEMFIRQAEQDSQNQQQNDDAHTPLPRCKGQDPCYP
jgi:RHS repeat-associated protein